jgi:GTPase SAR1 family protein
MDFNVKTVNLDGILLKIQVWQAAHSHWVQLPSVHFKGTVGVMFVFDMTNLGTLRRLMRPVSGWVGQAKQHAPPGTSYVLVGTKCDLTTMRETSAADIEAVVEEASTTLEACVPFLPTSAKSGANVDSASFLCFSLCTKQANKT